MTREESEQLERAVQADRDSNMGRNQSALDDQRKKMTVKYESPARIHRAASNEMRNHNMQMGLDSKVSLERQATSSRPHKDKTILNRASSHNDPGK